MLLLLLLLTDVLCTDTHCTPPDDHMASKESHRGQGSVVCCRPHKINADWWYFPHPQSKTLDQSVHAAPGLANHVILALLKRERLLLRCTMLVLLFEAEINRRDQKTLQSRFQSVCTTIVWTTSQKQESSN